MADTIIWYDIDRESLRIESFGVGAGAVINCVSSMTIGSLGGFSATVHVSGNQSNLTIRSYGDGYVTSGKRNFVKWTKVGSLDFTIDKTNIAGERPLDWKGLVYAIKKLSNKVVAYGENGVSFLIPADTSYGLNTFYRVGLKGKNAIAGDESVHFFVDKSGILWRLGASLERLDYSEYLSLISQNLVLSYDTLNRLLYICDGGIGYIYDPVVGSLGRCQPDITGIISQSEVLYVAASDEITNPIFELCTDVYDFGVKEYKSIASLEIDADVVVPLYASIDYKCEIDGDFVQTPWIRVQTRGLARVQAFGRDFRFRLKTETYEWFKLNSIKVNGTAHISGKFVPLGLSAPSQTRVYN